MIKTASKTMRIDLIPDIAAAPLERAPQQVPIAPGAGREYDRSSGVLSEDARAFFHSVYDAGFIADFGGRIREINSRAIDFFQYEPAMFLELDVADVVSGADEELLETVRHNLESERFTLIQAYCIRRDRSYFPAEIVVSRLAGAAARLCFFVRDITLRRRAEEMLRTEHAAIQNSAEGIAVTDVDGELEYVNPAVARLWRYASPEILNGKPFGILCREDTAGAGILRRVMETGDPWRGEVEALRTDASTFIVGVSAVCNRNTDGDVVGVVLLLNDLTDRRLAEESQRESERQRVMLETLGSACHHLGQPATVLTSNIELLDMKMKKKPPEFEQLIRQCLDACDQLADLLDRMRSVQEYRSKPYLSPANGNSARDTRIIEI